MLGEGRSIEGARWRHFKDERRGWVGTWTQIDVPLPHPLVLHISRSPMNKVAWVPNRSNYAALGLDDSYVVDAAPAAIVAAALDAPLRNGLLAIPFFDLDTVEAYPLALRLIVPNLLTAAAIDALIADLLYFCDRLGASYADAAAAARARAGGDPLLAEAYVREALAAYDTEVIEHVRARQDRTQKTWTPYQLFAGVMLLMVAITIAMMVLTR